VLKPVGPVEGSPSLPNRLSVGQPGIVTPHSAVFATFPGDWCPAIGCAWRTRANARPARRQECKTQQRGQAAHRRRRHLIREQGRHLITAVGQEARALQGQTVTGATMLLR
jgi:hypothetical protein